MTTIQHYSAETARTTIRHWGVRAYRIIPDAIQWRSLLWNFFRRELFGRFHGSLLGAFWVMVQPIFMFCVYFAIFGILFAPRLAEDGPDPGFAIYMFAGILSFTAINEGTMTALSAVVNNSNLVKKVKFPCEFLPMVPTLVSTCVYMVGCVVLVIAGLAAGEVHITWKLVLWPVFIVIQLIFMLGLGLLLAGANVFVRDIQHLYRIMATAWFFLTPIFWRFQMVEDKFTEVGAGWVVNVLMLNPAMPIVLGQRQIFGIGDEWHPDLYAGTYPLSLGENLLLASAWAAVMLFFFGYGFFKSRRHKFADLV